MTIPLGMAIAGLAALAVVFLVIGIARAQERLQPHNHRWYAPACCNGQDCRPLPDDAVVKAKAGYQFGPFLIPYDDKRIRRSEDAYFHGCINGSGELLCLYVPGDGT